MMNLPLKSDSQFSEKGCVIRSIERPLNMMKNAFYFILKALSFLKILKFLSWLFGHVEKIASGLTNNYNAHIAQYLTK